MSATYLDNYGPLLLMFILAAGLAGVLIMASTIVGQTQTFTAKRISRTNAAFAPRATRASLSPFISTWWL